MKNHKIDFVLDIERLEEVKDSAMIGLLHCVLTNDDPSFAKEYQNLLEQETFKYPLQPILNDVYLPNGPPEKI